MTFEQRIQATIGEYAYGNAALATENEILKTELTLRDARIADLEQALADLKRKHG